MPESLLMLDWTISIGNLLTIGMLLISGVWAFARITADVRVIKNDLKYVTGAQASLSETLLQLGTILTRVAVQDERLLMMSKKIEELSHGDGYVRHREKSN